MKINKSVKRSVDILMEISKAPNGLSFSDIYKSLDIPKSTAFDIVKTLLDSNMIAYHPFDNRKYVIGVNSFLIGTSYKSSFVEVAKRHMETLGNKLGKTVFLGVERDGLVVYLDKFEPQNHIITTATLGTKSPVHCTALGKAILSTYSTDKVLDIIKKTGLPKKTRYTITSIDNFLEELSLIRKQGYSVDDRESDENMLCISAPVFNNLGETVGAISASGFFNPSTSTLQSHGNAISIAASMISKEMGYLR